MKTFLMIGAVFVSTAMPALAIDAASLAVTEGLKRGKAMPIEAVQTLMRGADYWCYSENEAGCDWAERYLEVDEKRAIYEVSNAWDATRNVSFSDQAEFRDGRFICETGYFYVPSTYAETRATGLPVYGRELATIKGEMADNVGTDTMDCFDYVFGSVDEDAGLITITQRQFTQDLTTDPANDAEVTLHFDTVDAKPTLQPW